MKKYLLTVSAILTLLVAGCEMFPPDESQIPVELGTAPEILISQPASPDSDSTFTVTITPAAGTGYYAYLIVDEKMPDIDGSTLLSQDYEGLYGGLAEMSTTASVTIEANPDGGIMPGSLYYVYAVGANTSQGNPSAVAYDSVYTTNGNVPVFDDEVAFSAASDGSYVDIALNDVVTRGEGKVYYDILLPYTGVSALTDRNEVPADSITFSGKIVRVATPADVPSGAIVNITWDEGAFVNSANIEAKAYDVCTYEGLSANGKYGDGILYRKATSSWNINYPMRKVTEGTGESQKTSWVSTSEDTIGITDLSNDGFRLIADSIVLNAMKNYTVSYYNQDNSEISYNHFYINAVDDTTLVFFVDATRAIEKGTWMSISIPEGTLVDQWGNPNAEFTSGDNFIYSFGWEMTDLYGSYAGAGLVPVQGGYTQVSLNPGTGESIVIRPLTEDESGKNTDGHNVVIENLLFKGTKLNAYFGKEDGLLHIPAGQVLVEEFEKDYKVNGYVDEDKPIIVDGDTTGYELIEFDASLLFYDYNLYGNDVTLQLSSAGQLDVVPDTWVNYSSGWNVLITDGNTLVTYYASIPSTTLTRSASSSQTGAPANAVLQQLKAPGVIKR